MPPALGFKATLTGDTELLATLRALPTDLQAYALEKAVRRASQTVADAQKSGVPKGTGLLAKSLGIAKVKVYARKGFVWGAAGPRRGFRRALVRKGDRVRFLSAKKTEAAGDSARIANPVRYAHIVEKGRTSKKPYPGRRFMASAQKASAAAVQSGMAADVEAGIRRSVARLAKRGP